MGVVGGKKRAHAADVPRHVLTPAYRPRNSNFIAARAVGSYMPKLTRKAFEKYGFSTAALITDWTSIVGGDLAGYTAPERLKWPRGVDFGEVESGSEGRPGATLMLRVDPARALDVQYKTAQIVERINGYFGYNAIAAVRIVQGTIVRATPQPPALTSGMRQAPARTRQPSPPPAALSAIADDGLREALAKLHAGVTGQTRGL
jgi:hypothetical protein